MVKEDQSKLSKGQLATLEETRKLIKKSGFDLDNAEYIAISTIESYIAKAISTLPLEDLQDLLDWIKAAKQPSNQ